MILDKKYLIKSKPVVTAYFSTFWHGIEKLVFFEIFGHFPVSFPKNILKMCSIGPGVTSHLLENGKIQFGAFLSAKF